MSGPVIASAEIEIRPKTRNFDRDVSTNIAGPLGKLSGPIGNVANLLDKMGLQGAASMLRIGDKAGAVHSAFGKLSGAGKTAFTGIEAGAATADTALGTTAGVAAGTGTQLSLLGPAGDRAATGLVATGAGGESAAAGLEATETAAVGAKGMLLGLGVAAGALIAVKLGKWAFDGVGKFTDLAREVRTFGRVAGTSSEDSSRMVYALNTLGISTQAAGAGLSILAKGIGNGTTKLGDFGVQVAKTKDGNTDLVGTVLNIGDAYKSIEDPATRAALLQASFGRGGRALIPILGKTRAEIKALFDEAERTHSIFTEDDQQNAIAYGRATRELTQTFEGFQREIGSEVVPVLTGVIKIMTAGAQSAELLGKKVGSVAVGAGLMKAAFSQIPIAGQVAQFAGFAASLGDTSAQGEKLAAVQDFLAEKTAAYSQLVADGNEKSAEGRQLRHDMAVASDYLAQNEDKVNKALHGTSKEADEARAALEKLDTTLFGFGDAQRAATQAVIDLGTAQAGVVTATDNLNTAKAEGRQDNETDAQFQARIAQLYRDVATAQLGVGAAQDHVAQTAVAALTSQQAYDRALKDDKGRADLIAQLEDAKRKYGDTTGAIQAQIDKLHAWELFHPKHKKLDVKTDEAHGKVTALQAHIDGTHGKTVEIVANVRALYDRASFAILAAASSAFGALGLRAKGGPVLPGHDYVVGEDGPEILRMHGTSGTVIPNGQTTGGLRATAPTSAGNVSVVIHQTIEGNADRDVLAEANDRLIAELTAQLRAS